MASDEDGRVHGGPNLEELRLAGIQPTSLLDFSVNVNPYGPTSFMRGAIRDAVIERYPYSDGGRGPRGARPYLGRRAGGRRGTRRGRG